jgi:hypothetical protein
LVRLGVVDVQRGANTGALPREVADDGGLNGTQPVLRNVLVNKSSEPVSDIFRPDGGFNISYPARN